MIKSLFLVLVAAMFSTTVIAGDTYTALDVDNSGSISEAEAAALPGLTDQWTTLDADANGELTMEEFARFETSEIKAPEMK